MRLLLDIVVEILEGYLMSHDNVEVENAQVTCEVCVGIILNDIYLVPQLETRDQRLGVEGEEIS